MSAIILESNIVHYEVLGRGQPVIFLHGWVGSWRYWIPSMQAASTSHRAYALDLWGFGDTAKETSRYSITGQAQLLEDFLNELGVAKSALIVGHGLGSLVALQYAATQGFAVDRVMMIGFPLNGSQLDERLASETPTDLANWLLKQDPATEAARTEAPKADGLAIKASLEALKNTNTADLITDLNVATVFVYGQQDPVLSVPELNGGSGLPNRSHHIVFEKSGHFPMLDQANKFNRLVADFLALDAGESPRQLQLKDEWKRRVR